jgi:hypothetical protein
MPMTGQSVKTSGTAIRLPANSKKLTVGFIYNWWNIVQSSTVKHTALKLHTGE